MELTLKELKDLLAREDTGTTPLASEGEKVIVVAQRGWVAVGDWYQTGERVDVRNASIVRRWGTDKGLGQLATEGPRENTVLDPVPLGLRLHVLSVVALFPCNTAVWR